MWHSLPLTLLFAPVQFRMCRNSINECFHFYFYLIAHRLFFFNLLIFGNFFLIVSRTKFKYFLLLPVICGLCRSCSCTSCISCTSKLLDFNVIDQNWVSGREIVSTCNESHSLSCMLQLRLSPVAILSLICPSTRCPQCQRLPRREPSPLMLLIQEEPLLVAK